MRELKIGLRGVEITGSFNCYADIRANYRIYFDDNGEDDLATQAIEAATDYELWPDEAGECETNGIEVLRVEKLPND